MIDRLVMLESNGKYWTACYRDSLNRKVRKSLGPKKLLTRKAAMQRCQDMAAEFKLRPSTRDKARPYTLAEWSTRYLELKPDLALASVVILKNTAAMMLEHFGATTIGAVTREQARSFEAWLAKREKRYGGTLSESTRRIHLRNCKAMFQLAADDDLIPFNPFDRIKSSVPAVDKDWADITDEQTGKALEAAPDAAWRCLIALCRWAGLRRGEALRLGWADVDWDRKILTVQHEGATTTKRRTRAVPIAPALYRVIRDSFEAAQPGSVLVCPVNPHNLNLRLKTIMGAAGVPTYPKPFHTLRKCCETDWMGHHPVLTVCEWLGHSPAVAAKHYTRPTAEAMNRASGQIPKESPKSAEATV